MKTLSMESTNQSKDLRNGSTHVHLSSPQHSERLNNLPQAGVRDETPIQSLNTSKYLLLRTTDNVRPQGDYYSVIRH